MTKTLQLCRATLVASAFGVASLAVAGPSPASMEMQAALAKAEQGPDELRRYVHRTRMIHGLDYFEVMRVHEAAKAAPPAAAATPAIANAAPQTRTPASVTTR